MASPHTNCGSKRAGQARAAVGARTGRLDCLPTVVGERLGLPLGVDQQVTLAERRSRRGRKIHNLPEWRPSLDATQNAGRKVDLRGAAVLAGELSQDVVDPTRLAVGGFVVVTERAPELVHGVARQPLRRLSRIQGLLERYLSPEPTEGLGE